MTSIRRTVMPLVVVALLGLSGLITTASASDRATSSVLQGSGDPPPDDPVPELPEPPDMAEASNYIYDQSGTSEACLLTARIVQQPGRIMDAFGWIGSCFPDPHPFIFTYLKACVVETGSSGWREVSCTSGRTQAGFPNHYSYHAGWSCAPGWYYRGRAYGIFATHDYPYVSNPWVTTTGPDRCD